jgi:hypothetical protein
VNKRKLHDGESFAKRGSHPKTGRRLFAGGMVVLEDVGGGARVVMLRAVLSVRQFDYKVYVVMWRREVLAEASQRRLKLGKQVYISIESPLALAKLNPAPPCGPLAPKPKVPCPASTCGAISSPASSSSEKYFSIMLYAFM